MDPGTETTPSPARSARTVAGITVAELAGDLGIARVPVLREQLLGLLRPGSARLVLDLSTVSSCDANGLAVLVGTGRRARLLGGFLRLAAVPPPVDRVLYRTGLNRHFGTFPTVQAAIASPAGALHGTRRSVAGQSGGLGQAA